MKADITTILNAFRESIDQRFLPHIDTSATVVLEEDKQDATCRQVTLSTKGMSIKPVLVKLEGSEEREKAGKKVLSEIDIHPLLNNSADLKKGCDYLLICPTTDKIYFLLIELKSKTSNNWLDQCVAGECLINYVASTIIRVNELDIEHRFVFRHVLFKVMKNPPKRALGNKVAFYSYDAKKNAYHAAWPCTKEGESHDLRLFMREK